MPKTVYFDCFSGASGDMVLGALLDLGLPLEDLRGALGSLAIEYGDVSAERVLRAGVSATRFRSTADELERRERIATHAHAGETDPEPVHAAGDVGGSGRGTAGKRRSARARGGSDQHDHRHHDHPPDQSHQHGHRRDHPPGSPGPAPAHHHHSLAEIQAYIERSALSRAGKNRATRLFHRLAEAEAAIHEMPLDRVHLHEVGALDSIIDIVGAVYGMEWLGADEIVVSPLKVGSGTVECAHGVLPVPAPATARLLRGVPIYAGAVAHELVTPTGALLITDFANRFGDLPPMRLEAIGYGAAARDVAGHPNVLRVLVGETPTSAHAETIAVLECEIDDMNPQIFGPLMDRLFEAGALDVFYAPVQMKKNRPGTLVTVLAPPSTREAVVGVLFAETTTIGVRRSEASRECLEREVRTIDTPVGPIRFKIARRAGRIVNAAPEFDDCAKAAAERHLPIKAVQALATKAWLDSGR